MENVFIEKRDVFTYPLRGHSFGPSQKYPEHPKHELSVDRNEVYDMVRSALHGFGLDADNFGKSSWNPLGHYI
jgi:hypothetical protein